MQHVLNDAAPALYVHRNTLHKRLRRIEELLDVRLDRMDDLLEVYAGLLASDLVGPLTLE